jgi:hypothetical protein
MDRKHQIFLCKWNNLFHLLWVQLIEITDNGINWFMGSHLSRIASSKLHCTLKLIFINRLLESVCLPGMSQSDPKKRLIPTFHERMNDGIKNVTFKTWSMATFQTMMIAIIKKKNLFQGLLLIQKVKWNQN